MEPRTVVVSDIHYGAAAAEGQCAFLSFLDRVPELCDDLLINGDMFDYWFEYREAIPRGFVPLLGRLRAVTDSGVTVRFIPGNHDAWAGPVLGEETGMKVLAGPVGDHVGGRRALIAHGDGLGGGDLKYRILRSCIRSRAVVGLFRWIHPDIGIRIARSASRTSARGQGPDSAGRSGRLVTYARDALSTDAKLELVVLGHTHRPEATELLPGRWYLNSGDWVSNRSYGLVTPREVSIKWWDRDHVRGT